MAFKKLHKENLKLKGEESMEDEDVLVDGKSASVGDIDVDEDQLSHTQTSVDLP